MEIVRRAASSDPAIAELHEQRRRARQHEPKKTVAKRLQELGALPNETSVQTAADLLWVYTSPEIYRNARDRATLDSDPGTAPGSAPR